MKKVLVIILLFLFAVTMSSNVLAADEAPYLKVNLLNQDPDPAVPGDYVELRWKVEKFGSDTLSNIVFDLDVPYPLSFDSSDVKTKSFGNWKGFSDSDDYYILYYKLLVDKDAIEDVYDVKLTVSSDQFDLTKEFSVRVGEKEEASFALGQLITSPLKLYGDSDENKCELNLENIGDCDAKFVTVDLLLPDGFTPTYGFSTRANLGTISHGGNKVAIFYVDLDETIFEGVYDLKLNVSYSDDNDNVYKSIILPLSLPVSGKPKFLVDSVSFSQENIFPGSTIDMSVVVKNVGTRDAESVSLRVFKESSQPFDFADKSDFIGHLAPGESGVAILTFTVDDEAFLKDFLLDLEVRGIYNQEVIVDDGVALIPVSKGLGKNSGLFGIRISAILALILLIIVGFISYKVGVSKH